MKPLQDSSHAALLVLNAGSSSLKFSVFKPDAEQHLHLIACGAIEELSHAAHFWVKDEHGVVIDEQRWPRPRPNPSSSPETMPSSEPVSETTAVTVSDASITPAIEALGHSGAIDFLFTWLRAHNNGGLRLIGVGHRVVHGGVKHAAPELVSASLMDDLHSLIPLAPLHQPHNLLAIQLIQKLLPELAQVACFDTSFHHSAPAVSQAFALPASITARGVKRYGFHGLSYEFIAANLAAYDPRAASGKTIVLHLGNGASMCALDAGKSIASTMGFTALDGLMMGSRCGAIDPGVILYMLNELKMDVRAIEHMLYQESGLLGVSGISSDMRVLQESQSPAAAEAIELFIYRISRELGSLVAALGGLDAIVFTAGIGEHSAPVRAAVCRAAAWLGIELDEAANLAGQSRISTAGSRCSAWIIPTNEELMIARHSLRLLSALVPLTIHSTQESQND